MTEIPEISIDDVSKYIQKEMVGDRLIEDHWTVLKFKNPLACDPIDYVNQINQLIVGKSLEPYAGGISTTYGEKYLGISIQKNIDKQHITDPDYDSNDITILSTTLDKLTGKPLYYTPMGLTHDENHKSNKNIKIIDLNKRPDLKPVWEWKRTRKKSTSYLVLNDWAAMFKGLLREFLDRRLLLYYGRLLQSEAGLTSRIHHDGDHRIHIPIYTNDKCVTVFYDRTGKNIIGEYHMPADGYLYLFNGGALHKFYNHGSTSRLHCLFLITQYNLWPNLYKSYDDCLNNFKIANDL